MITDKLHEHPELVAFTYWADNVSMLPWHWPVWTFQSQVLTWPLRVCDSAFNYWNDANQNSWKTKKFLMDVYSLNCVWWGSFDTHTIHSDCSSYIVWNDSWNVKFIMEDGVMSEFEPRSHEEMIKNTFLFRDILKWLYYVCLFLYVDIRVQFLEMGSLLPCGKF